MKKVRATFAEEQSYYKRDGWTLTKDGSRFTVKKGRHEYSLWSMLEVVKFRCAGYRLS